MAARKNLPIPDIKYLNECFELSNTSPSGLLWKDRPDYHYKKKKNVIEAGRVAGSEANGYWVVGINGKSYKAQRIIYSMLNPEVNIDGYVIDHIDGNSLNNKKENLRLASFQQNSFNSKTPNSSSTGFKGIYKVGSKWKVRFIINNSNKTIGTFDSLEKAIDEYNKAIKRERGEFSWENKAIGGPENLEGEQTSSQISP